MVNANVELYPMFQKIVKLSEPQQDFAFEALIRGKDHLGRRVNPNELFNQAAQESCIEELDFKARKIALQVAGSKIKNSLLFLNCHRASLDIGKIFEEEVEVSYHRIVLEITEQRRMRNISEVKRCLRQYRDMGMRIAIDDFGTGFSNFDLIGELAPDFVKLDRSIITPIERSEFARSVVEGLVAFASLTGIKLIAEGIETQAQQDILMELGVDYGQGFHLGYPFDVTNCR